MTDEPTGGGPSDSGPPKEPSAPQKRRRKSRDEVLRHELNVYQAELETQNEELRRAQVALEGSRARYEDLYARAPAGLVTVGAQGKILTFNDRAARTLRLRVHGTSAKHITEFMSPENVEIFERHRAQVLSSGEEAAFELEMRRATGAPFWAAILMAATRDASDESLVCQIGLTDISERKRMRDEVAHLAAIVESADQAIISQSLDGIITSWNAGAERMFGYSAHEAIGNDVEMLIPAECRDEEKSILGRARYGSTVSGEATWRRRDGTRVQVFRATARIESEGRIAGISHIVQDITAQAESRQEVARLLRDLQEADRRKDNFIATLAHELRNPLAPIRNAAAVLRFVPDLDPKVQWCRDVIDRQVKHMSALLEDLLDVSRLTRDMIRLHRERVELGTVIVQAVETTRPLIESRRHRLTLDLPSDPIEVEGDLNRLIQIFGNLLNNAAKYTEPEGDIRISAERTGECVIVRVLDSGVGIEEENVARIFELFSQVAPGAEGAEGLGIGLALVKGLVSRHGGTVTARSDGIGKGSEFAVTLPLAAPAPGAAPGVVHATGESGRGPVHERRVLVVDDNVDAAESLAVILRIDGHDVRTAHDGEHAVLLAAEFRPHVMLLDLGMPKLSGYEVARRVRARPSGESVFLVACTGWGQPEDRRRSKEAGFDHHLVKPVSAEAVLGVVASAPGRGGV
jgi:PAS domain S-box-containing protein